MQHDFCNQFDPNKTEAKAYLSSVQNRHGRRRFQTAQVSFLTRTSKTNLSSFLYNKPYILGEVKD
ncbi:hypothetical protein HMPREF9554_02406 [Treponema phagedenis F0421]|nr:hypothetical protein HMPREF9554_02406 [Treponema phagedenis F0421]